MKKQKIIWLDSRDIKLIEQKIEEEGLSGKGKWERFMEKIAREKLIFIQGEGKIEIIVKD